MFGLAPFAGAPFCALGAASPSPPTPHAALPWRVRRTPGWMLGEGEWIVQRRGVGLERGPAPSGPGLPWYRPQGWDWAGPPLVPWLGPRRRVGFVAPGAPTAYVVLWVIS